MSADDQHTIPEPASNDPITTNEPSKDETVIIKAPEPIEDAISNGFESKKDEVKSVDTKQNEIPKVHDPKQDELPKVDETKQAELPKVDEPKQGEQLPKVDEIKQVQLPKVDEQKQSKLSTVDIRNQDEKPNVETKQDETAKVDEPKQSELPTVDVRKQDEKPNVETKQDETAKVDEPKQSELPTVDVRKQEEKPKVETKQDETAKVDEPKQSELPTVDVKKQDEKPKVETKQDETAKVDEPKQSELPTVDVKKKDEKPKVETKQDETAKVDEPKQVLLKKEMIEDKANKVIEEEDKHQDSMDTQSSDSHSTNASVTDKTLSKTNYITSMDCRTIHIKKGIPKDWTFPKIKHFIMDNVKSIALRQNFIYVVILKDQLKPTGEQLVKFASTEECQAACNDLRRIKGFSVVYDIGGVKAKEAKFGYKKNFESSNATPDKYELIKKKHDEVFTEKLKEESNHEEPAAKKFRQDDVKPRPAVRPFSPPRVPYLPRAFFPSEREVHETYGLSPVFLNSLKLRPPLTNKVLIMNLEERVDEAKVREIFGLAGHITKVTALYRKNGAPKHKIIVEYDHPVEAVQAISLFRGKPLYDKPIQISMDHFNFPRPMPEGLMGIGMGLGQDGEILKGVRATVELQKIKETLLDMGNIENVATNTEQSPFVNPIHIGAINKQNNQNNQSNQSLTNQNAFLNTLTTLCQQPNLLVGLSALANAQGLLQQGTGDMAALLSNLQGQNVPSISPNMSHNAPNMSHNAPNMPHNAPNMLHNAPNMPHNAPNMPHNAPNMPHNAPNMPHNAPNMANNAPNMAHNAPNMGPHGVQGPPGIRPHNVPPVVQYPTPRGHNPRPRGIRPTHNAPHFAQNAPQQTYQPTFVQNTVESDWKVRGPAQTVQSQPMPSQQMHSQQMPSQQMQSQQMHSQQMPSHQMQSQQMPSHQMQSQQMPSHQMQSQQVQYGSEPVMYNRQQTSYDNNRNSYDNFGKDNINSLDITRSVQKHGESEKKSDMLVFDNLPSSVTVEALNMKMREVGELRFGEITGQGRAIVRFKHVPDAERCIKLFNRSKVDGQTIEVKYF